MKLTPNYSYEFNCVLNDTYNEDEQIKNFASLLSDKDRFLVLLAQLEKNSKLIEEKLGFEFKEEIEFFVVRAEKFKSFSEPVTIEYSLLPDEMLLFLLKESIKVSAPVRFPDEVVREEVINSFIDYLIINLDWESDLVKYSKCLHDASLEKYTEYKFEEGKYNFESKSMKELLDELYSEMYN